MTTTRRGRGRLPSAWTLWAWLMVVAALVSIAAGVAGGILSPSVVLDIVSLWPLLLGAFLIAAALLPLRKRGPARTAAALPMLILTMLGASVVLHLIRWDRLPSAAASLAGPPAAGVAEASLSLELPGRLDVGADGVVLYAVTPEHRGGSVGVPEALESEFEGGPLFILLRERDAGRWFRTAGWEVTLAAGTRWTLSISSPDLRADLRDLNLSSLGLSGRGAVTLPGASGSDLAVSVSGDYVIDVPASVPVEVIGAAAVPGGWVPTEDGQRNLFEGFGLVLTVADGATVEVRQP